MSNPPTLDKFRGALAGTFAGDALGAPVEGLSADRIFRERGRVDKMLDARLGAGTYTDDTEMMIGVAQTLVERGDADPEFLATRFVENFSPDRGYGHGTVATLGYLADGTPWAEAARRVFAAGSMGNGAAMRVAPVGVMFHDDPERLVVEARRCAMVTHVHRLGVEGAVLQALAVGMAVGLDNSRPLDVSSFLDELGSRMTCDEYKKALDTVSGLIRQPHDPDRVIGELGCEALALRSVPCSIYLFLRYCSDFRESVSRTVSLGGDADTTGAMTGALCGAYLGAGAIPSDWYDKLENGPTGRDYVMELGVALYDRWRRAGDGG